MSGPILALRTALRSACLGDATLAGLMDGSVRLYDEPPRGGPPLYGVFGETSLRDLSTSTERGHEQEAELVVWGVPGSAAAAIQVADRIAQLLDQAPLALAGHRLVHLSVIALEAARDPESRLVAVTVRLRAVTEVTD